MRGFSGRGSRGGPRRTGRSHYGTKTRRGGRRITKNRRNLGRLGIGLGIAAGGLLAVNAGILGAAGTSRAIKELSGTARSIRKWATSRAAGKARRAASTVAFHAKRVVRLKIARRGMAKFRSPLRAKIKIRRWGKR
jgi:hypothetical protein